MASIIAYVVDTYNYYFWEKSHPKVADFYLLGSPIPFMFILLSYIFIVSKGPKLMEKRKPFDLKYVMICYNVLQAIINIAFVHAYTTKVLFPGAYKFVCQAPSPPDFPDTSVEAIVVLKFYHFFLSRTLDLLDTVFMVLRKKQRQISFLHLYHHFFMAVGCWLVAKYIPGGDPSFFGALNSFVHIIMYTYYLVSTIYPQYKRSIWWKRHITELQITQFAVVLLQLIIGLYTPGCQYPRRLQVLFISQTATITILFINFYVKTYIIKKKEM